MLDRCATQLESAGQRLVARFGRKWTQPGARSGWPPAVACPGVQQLGQLLAVLLSYAHSRIKITKYILASQIYIYCMCATSTALAQRTIAGSGAVRATER